MSRTVLRGEVITPEGSVDADLVIEGSQISVIGTVAAAPDDRVIDCTGRRSLPGMIDTHSHADPQVFDDGVALALLRQGVTSIIAGQDGVSFAPGDGLYASRYFAAINGAHPTYRGGGVGELLAGYDRTTPINVGYLVPAGSVREMIMGLADGPADHDQLLAMQGTIADGLAEGALGLSSGLDYLPGCFSGPEELAELCRPVAAAGGVYVTHMRGGYEENSAAGIDEVARIARTSGAKVHVSHFVDSSAGMPVRS